jgi:hypothetical protein
MNGPDYHWKTQSLFGLSLLAVLYAGWFFLLHAITGIRWLDGSLGVLLGLYICSRPAGNAVDLLFFQRHVLAQISTEWVGLAWLGLNLLVLCLGTAVIILGAVALVGSVV